MSASTSTAPATYAPLAVAAPAAIAPLAAAPDTVEQAPTAPATVESDAPIVASVACAPSVPRRGAPMRRTATYLDLRAWPGYAAAVGLPEPPRMPKSFYYSNHFTKTKWGSMDPVPMPKREKKRVDKKALVITGPVDWQKFKTMKGVKKQHAVTNGKVDETPLTKSEKKLAKRFRARYDLRRVKERVAKLKRADKYAAATKAKKLAAPVPDSPVATSTVTIEVDPVVPGAFPDDPSAEVQNEPDASDDASPSLTVALFRLAVEVVAVMTKRKRVHAEDEDKARGLKRRRVGTNGPSQSRAADRSLAGKPHRKISTGVTAPTHNHSTAAAASSTARKPMKLKATLSKCPPPARTTLIDDIEKLEPLLVDPPMFGVAAVPVAGSALAATPPCSQEALAPQPAPEPSVASSSSPIPARPMALSRQPTVVFGSVATRAASSASAATAAQASGTALLREAPTVIDFGPTPSSSSSGLSRQPAAIFNFGATSQSSASTSKASFVPFQDVGFLPPLWALSSSNTNRGSRGGARAHKYQEHKEARGGRKDRDDGAASA